MRRRQYKCRNAVPLRTVTKAAMPLQIWLTRNIIFNTQQYISNEQASKIPLFKWTKGEKYAVVIYFMAVNGLIYSMRDGRRGYGYRGHIGLLH
jgi:hypothetical protein